MFAFRSNAARRSVLAAILVAVIVGTLFGAGLNARRSADSIREQLGNRAETIASLLDASKVGRLTGESTDETASYYIDLKKQLNNLKVANDDVRSLYITKEKQNELYFYVDSEEADSQYYSPPGEHYPEATPLFKSLFASGRSAVEGPQKDEYGTWVSGLAPIKDPDNGKIIAVLGLDISASYYYQSMIMAGIIPLLLGLFVLGILLVYEWLHIREQRALRLRSELVSIASHELRSPLTGILWAAESLMPQLEGEQRHRTSQIYSSASSLQIALEDILQLSQLTSKKKQNLMFVDSDISIMIRQICEAQRLVAAEKAAEIVLDEAWQHTITARCDENTFKRALHNVISNAVKYTKPSTKVSIHYGQNDTMHLITVADQGIGIPAAEQKQVLDGFYRASNAKDSGIKGTGMGLYLTKGIMKQHGGHIEIKSEENVGTTIILALPK